MSVLLGFSGNVRSYKHASIESLEKNSGKPYEIELAVKLIHSKNVILPMSRSPESKNQEKNSGQVRVTHKDNINCLAELQTTPLFEYLIKNIDKDKKRLAATAQLYLARGLWEICVSSSCCLERSKTESRDLLKKVLRERDFSACHSMKSIEMTLPVFFAGGMANNKIISDYLVSKGTIVSKKISRGDAGLSFGQLIYYLANTRN